MPPNSSTARFGRTDDEDSARAAFALLRLDMATATLTDVRKAYRTRALAVHPDRAGPTRAAATGPSRPVLSSSGSRDSRVTRSAASAAEDMDAEAEVVPSLSSSSPSSTYSFVELHRAYEAAQAHLQHRESAAVTHASAVEEATAVMSSLERKWEAAAQLARNAAADQWLKMCSGKRGAAHASVGSRGSVRAPLVPPAIASSQASRPVRPKLGPGPSAAAAAAATVPATRPAAARRSTPTAAAAAARPVHVAVRVGPSS